MYDVFRDLNVCFVIVFAAIFLALERISFVSYCADCRDTQHTWVMLNGFGNVSTDLYMDENLSFALSAFRCYFNN